jgi:hypothetical protein
VEYEGESSTVQPARWRGWKVASSEIHRRRSQLSVDLSRLGGSQREAQEFNSQTHELMRQQDLADLPVLKGRPRGKIVVGADFPIGK